MAATNDNWKTVDAYVGHRLCTQRLSLSMSREQLAAQVRLTPMAIKRYENGFERISASKLYEFSKALDVPVSYFFSKYVANTKR